MSARLLAALLLAGALAGCGDAAPLASGPRWACPSPTPLPYGPDGPEKARPPTGPGTPTAEPVYYEVWEREYGEGGALLGGLAPLQGPPYPSPTPYGLTGSTYSMGQRVEVAPLHVAVSARAEGMVGPGRQRYLLTLDWVNPTGRPYPVDYLAQLWLRAVRRPDGSVLTGDGWGVDAAESAALGLAVPASVAPGASRVVLAAVAPPGAPRAIELRFPAGTAEPGATPTPNAALRDPARRWLSVAWVDARPVGPPCADPGALTDWGGSGPKAVPRDAALALQAPAGGARVVQVALAQVGKRYIWGAEGPEAFDCSGLMYWSYAQVGVAIPRATAGQWPRMRPVVLGAALAGDLVFMDTRDALAGPPQVVTHVGMLADVDGDGRWDLIHAASPRLGVRVEYDVLRSRYYGPRMFSEGRTAR